jgi:hypothetical protein
MADQIENQLIAELSRRVVAEVAPDEQIVFNPVCAAYFKNPEKSLKGESVKDELAGLGIGEIAVILTPIILEILKEVLKDVLKDSIKSSVTKNTPTLLEKLKAFFGQLFAHDASESTLPQDVQLPPLSQAQLIQARQRAYEKAVELGVDASKSSQIADCVVASLQMPLPSSIHLDTSESNRQWRHTAIPARNAHPAFTERTLLLS